MNPFRSPAPVRRITSLILALSALAWSRGRVVGYLPTWGNFPNSVHAVNLDVVTHLDVAFVNPDAAGAVALPNGISQVVQAAHAKGVKVLISIGGAGADATVYSSLLGDPTRADTFVRHLVQATVDHDLDGVDVDIEGDVLDGKAVNAAQYEAFVTKLGTALRAKSKLMTAALGGWFAVHVTNAAVQRFDFLNVMSYDAYGSWSASPGQHSSYQMALDDFAFWTGVKGMPADRVVIGVPFYGYGWGKYKKNWRYADLVSGFPGAENQDQIGSGTDVIYYNGMSTIRDKAVWAKQNAGGVMIWELTHDVAGSKSLLGVIGGVFGAHDPVVPDNLAKGRSVQVSSTEPGLNIASHLTDGDYGTRWASEESDDQWFSVDLGSAFRIDRIRIRWEAAYGKDYAVETSLDGLAWVPAKTVTGNVTLDNDHVGLTGVGRHVRIRCTARGTIYGYSVHELEVYGQPSTSISARAPTIGASHRGAGAGRDARGRKAEGSDARRIGTRLLPVF